MGTKEKPLTLAQLKMLKQLKGSGPRKTYHPVKIGECATLEALHRRGLVVADLELVSRQRKGDAVHTDFGTVYWLPPKAKKTFV